MRIFLLITILLSSLYSADIPDMNASTELNSTIDVNGSVDINSTNTQQPPKQTIFLSYEDVPAKVFVGQVFPIKVKALIATENFDEINTPVIKENGTKIENIDAKWKWKNDELFYKTFYLKAIDENATFPQLSFDLYQNGVKVDSQPFPPLSLNIINLKANRYFSNVIADSLTILKSKTTNFDENNLITVLEIEAKNSNLKDFKLSTVIRDGIDSAEYNAPNYKIYYYAIIPKHTEYLTFTYFNTIKNDFVKKKVKIVVENNEVSTQSNLNPKDDNFKFYKNAVYIFFALLFLILLLKRRKIVYFLLLGATVGLFFYNMNPLSSIKISADTKVFILPTRNSTVFFVTSRTIYVQKIKKIENYVKIILPNGKIGWIKDNDVIEN